MRQNIDAQGDGMDKRAAILDDDSFFGRLLRRKVEGLFQKYQLDMQIDVFSTPEELIRSSKAYSLFFMDIILPGHRDGVDIVQDWIDSGKLCNVIYVSAYDEQVFRTFESRAVGFVRKTHLDEDLENAIVAYIKRVNETLVVLQEGQRIHFFNSDEILYLNSNNHYIVVHMWNGEEELVRGKLDDMEQLLADHGFIRIHISYMINLKYVASIDRKRLCLKNKQICNISGKYRNEVFQKLGTFFSKTEDYDY